MSLVDQLTNFIPKLRISVFVHESNYLCKKNLPGPPSQSS